MTQNPQNTKYEAQKYEINRSGEELCVSECGVVWQGEGGGVRGSADGERLCN